MPRVDEAWLGRTFRLSLAIGSCEVADMVIELLERLGGQSYGRKLADGSFLGSVIALRSLWCCQA